MSLASMVVRPSNHSALGRQFNCLPNSVLFLFVFLFVRQKRSRLGIDRYAAGQFGQGAQHDQQRARIEQFLVFNVVVGFLGNLFKV